MTDYRIGKRMQLHPATDRWMMGVELNQSVGTGQVKP